MTDIKTIDRDQLIEDLTTLIKQRYKIKSMCGLSSSVIAQMIHNTLFLPEEKETFKEKHKVSPFGYDQTQPYLRED